MNLAASSCACGFQSWCQLPRSHGPPPAVSLIAMRAAGKLPERIGMSVVRPPRAEHSGAKAAACYDCGIMVSCRERTAGPNACDQSIAEPGRTTRICWAKAKPLANAIQAGVPHSMIFWGPPGVGKTTPARLLADAFDAEMIALSAVMAGVKDIREAVRRAQMTREQFNRTHHVRR